MSRKDDLLQAVKNDVTLVPLIDEMVFLENQLEELKKLPFIKVNPQNPYQQKATPAQKQYKELLQQYGNIVKIIARVSGDGGDHEESPLREWIKKHVNSE